MKRILSAAVLPLTFFVLAANAGTDIANGTPENNVQLASVYAVIADLDTGSSLYSKRDDRVASIASITKLMTAMVVLDSGQPLDEWITILERDRPAAKNAYSRLRIDSEATRADLLRITLMSSENLAAHTLARHHSGGFDAFVEAMNDKAAELGMEQTRFVDPSGLSLGNQSTAADLARMVRAANDYPTIAAYSTSPNYTVTFRKPRYQLSYGNTNPLVRRADWQLGLSKTGYLTEAGRCLVMVTRMNEQDVVIVLLNSFGTRSPIGDAGRIRRWLETGAPGSVAGAARDYERRIAASYSGSERSESAANSAAR